jgi:hypothetical protein
MADGAFCCLAMQTTETTTSPARTFAAQNTAILSAFDIEPPDWFPAKMLSPMVGFSRSSLYELASAGKIRSANFRKKGQKKAKRLFSYSSILKYIEAHATGGMEPTGEEAAA